MIVRKRRSARSLDDSVVTYVRETPDGEKTTKLRTVLDRDGLLAIHAESLRALRAMPDAIFDAVVTDTPYDLTAVSRGGSQRTNDPNTPFGRHALQSKPSGGFMGHKWDGTGIAFRVVFWREVLRVLKPGGHLLAFGGTRTYHRMTVAIEDAGFEIRDSIDYLYGSGYPKSLNVAKAIDKAAGVDVKSMSWRPTTPEAIEWSGWGTALKPAHEPIVVARKPVVGSVSKNVLERRTGGINIEACRVGSGADKGVWPITNRSEGSVAMGRKHAVETDTTIGRWPPNVVLAHSAECRRSVNECTPGCPVRLLDEQSGELKSGSRAAGSFEMKGFSGNWGDKLTPEIVGDSGGASRYFPTFEWSPLDDLSSIVPFIYTAKASKTEKNEGLEEKNSHSTVKPVALIRWLIRLVTSPGGTVLDPFLGSGTTLVAARAEDRRCVGIEREKEYVEIIRARAGHATKQTSLFEVGVLGGSVEPLAPIVELPASAKSARRSEESKLPRANQEDLFEEKPQ